MSFCPRDKFHWLDRMQILHLTPDTPRSPRRVSPGEPISLIVGIWPIEPGQSVWVNYFIRHPNGTNKKEKIEATW